MANLGSPTVTTTKNPAVGASSDSSILSWAGAGEVSHAALQGRDPAETSGPLLRASVLGVSAGGVPGTTKSREPVFGLS